MASCFPAQAEPTSPSMPNLLGVEAVSMALLAILRMSLELASFPFMSSIITFSLLLSYDSSIWGLGIVWTRESRVGAPMWRKVGLPQTGSNDDQHSVYY